MSAGRGTHIGVALAALACIATMSAANTDAAGKAKTRFVFLKARVGSDGVVTPSQPETISVSRMAPTAKFAVFIEPPPTTLQCGELYFCDVAPAAPASGSPPFVANRKGRAVVTFVMPETYDLETDPFNPKIRQPVTFANQQRIHIDVEGSSSVRNVKRQSFGFARAIVQRPSS